MVEVIFELFHQHLLWRTTWNWCNIFTCCKLMYGLMECRNRCWQARWLHVRETSYFVRPCVFRHDSFSNFSHDQQRYFVWLWWFFGKSVSLAEDKAGYGRLWTWRIADMSVVGVCWCNLSFSSHVCVCHWPFMLLHNISAIDSQLKNKQE